jgi:hypothetical protein
VTNQSLTKPSISAFTSKLAEPLFTHVRLFDEFQYVAARINKRKAFGGKSI